MNKKKVPLENFNIESKIYTPFDVDIQNIKNAVNLKINSAYTERNENFMKTKKKMLITAFAAALALCVTVFAANGIVKTWMSSSSAIPAYKSLPTVSEVKEDIGYDPVIIDTFENGYAFKDGNVVKNNLSDENGKSIEKFKSVSFRYEKNGDTVYFSQNKYNSETETKGEVIATEKDTDIYCYGYTNKLVPPDYKLTADDKKAEENGELVFSYGSSEVEISKVQSVTFKKDGVEYCLMQIDGKLSVDELAKMAKEVIKKQ